MKNKKKLWWAIGISIGFTAAISLLFILLFLQQSMPQKRSMLQDIFSTYGIHVFSAALALIAGFGFIVAWAIRFYIEPVEKLAEEVELIYSVNPSRRVDAGGKGGIRHLTEKINAGAEKYEALEKSVAARVNTAKMELEREKNILAAIMAELPEAVLICNQEGRILLYNSQAKRFFGEKNGSIQKMGRAGGVGFDPASDISERAHLGIGRSIFGLIGENIIQHALEEITEKLAQNQESAVSNFVVMGKSNRLLKAEAVPILNHQKIFSGFIVIFTDITQGLRNEARSEFLLGSFQKKIRHSVASIKSAIEIILDYPEMDSSRRHHLREIIHRESESLSHLIQGESKGAFKQNKTQWPLMPIAASELVETIRKKAKERLKINLVLEASEPRCWVKVDTYAMILIFLFLLDRVRDESEQETFSCRFLEKEDFVCFDMKWEGHPVKIEALRRWETLELNFEKEGMPLHVKEVLDHHKAEIWSYSEHGLERRSCLRLYLPAFRPYEQDAVRQAAVLPEKRTEFYDFDLFHQPGQTPDLDNRLLSDLTYTVFDTETTGLDPDGGDAIISIGALRIVNSRLLAEERFDQMVNPERNIPMATTRIHGIDNDMVRSQPTIDVVLPTFYKFVDDTIMVGHHAAFDMRMLQIYEQRTRIKFINPVLDTLLLSAVVHPMHDNHRLSAIADRLGVEVVGRHTAMGDAIMTAKIFLKLIPLLANLGIRTLIEAREASEKTYYARFKYCDAITLGVG